MADPRLPPSVHSISAEAYSRPAIWLHRLAVIIILLAGFADLASAITAEAVAEREAAETGDKKTTDDGSGPASPVSDPGPDLANFPNSSYTLKKGGIYLESTPLTYYGSTNASPAQWNISYLLRYGLFEDIELRLFSNGPTFRSGEVGNSPIAIDTKAHLWDFAADSLNASIGVEAYVQPSNWLASADFRQPLQFAVNLLVDHNLPWDIAFGWNIGFNRTQGQGLAVSKPTIQWAFQKNLSDDIAVFIQGYHNSAALPGVPPEQSLLAASRQTDVIGFGGQWSVNTIVAIFGNMNWGLTALSPKEIATVGFAVAF